MHVINHPTESQNLLSLKITCEDSEASEPIDTNARPAKTRFQNMGECGDHD